MKKTLIAAAALTAMAASAMAANVTLFGKIDQSVVYEHTSAGKDTVAMKGGFTSGSRWGIKTTEKVTKNTTVGANFIGGVSTDLGVIAQKDADKKYILFGRECDVFIQGPAGKLSLGRHGDLFSDCELGIYTGVSAFGTTWGNGAWSATGLSGTRRNNVYTYQTPTGAGVTGYLQYASGDADQENMRVENTRELSAGLTYAGKDGKFVAVVRKELAAKDAAGDDVEDPFLLGLGGNMKFGAVTVYAQAEYYKDTAPAAWYDTETPDKGYQGSVSVDVKAFGGTVKAGVGYGQAKFKDDNKANTWNAIVAYKYDFSKQTSMYGGYGYKDVNCDDTNKKNDGSSHQVFVGLVHSF